MAFYVSFQTNGGLPVYNPVENVVSIPNLDNYIPYKASDGVYSYSFDGWYYDVDCTAQALTDDPISANTILYAKWNATQIGGYSITFETNGGTPTPTNLTNQVAIPDPLPSISKSGFTFVGWKWGNTANAVDVTPGEPIYADATIYAVFTGADYNITYVLNGGTNNPSNPSTYSLGSAYIPLLAPTKANYSFAGWYEESTFVTRVYGVDVGSSGDKTFYAKWVDNYVVTWFSNGGSDVPNSENVTALPNPLPATTKTGYTFNGWYYESSFTTQAQAGDAVAESKILYAKWTKTSYTITYILDGGTNSANNPTTYDKDSLIIFENASKTGYVFNGWFSDSEMTIAITGIAKGSTGNKTVYAKFTASPSGYSITYIENGGSPEQTNLTNQNALPNPLPSISKIGSTFLGWFTDQELLNQAVAGATINANTTLYAKFVEGNNPIPVNPDTKRSGYIHANRKDTTPTDNSNKGITSGGVKVFVDVVKSNLQEQIDGLNASQNVVDIVGTKADLDVYNTTSLLNDDKIQVLQDETHDGASTYYKWDLSVWTYIGRTGTGYTKNEADNLLNDKVNIAEDMGLTHNDLTDTLKAQYNEAYTKAHEHSNKSTLDNTTASYTSEEKTKLGALPTNAELTADLGDKVDKDGDKVLTDNNYSNDEMNKVKTLQNELANLKSLVHETIVQEVEDDFYGGTINVPSSVAIGETSYVVLDNQDFKLNECKGKTLVNNQLIDPSNYPSNKTENNVTFTKNGSIITVVVGDGGASARTFHQLSDGMTYLANHKYLVKGSANVGLGGGIQFYNSTSSQNYIDEGNGIITDAMSSVINNSTYRIDIKSGTPAGTYIFESELIDLTKKFTSGNEPSTVAEYYRLCGSAYTPYNSGELKDTLIKKIESVGYNKFSGVNWQSGKTINSANNLVANANYNTCSDYISVIGGATYKYLQDVEITSYNVTEYDINKNRLNLYYKNVGTSITLSNNCSFVRIGVSKDGGSALPTKCLLTTDTTATIDSWKPYSKSTLTLATQQNLKGVNTAQDRLYIEKNTNDSFYSLKKTSVNDLVDIGTLDYTYDSVNSRFTSTTPLSNVKLPSLNTTAINGLCPLYEVVGADYTANTNMTIGVNNLGAIRCKNTTYTDAITFKTAHSGVYLVFEKLTPTTTTILNNLTYEDIALLVEQGGTIEVYDENDNLQVLNITFDFDIKYFRN